MEKLLAQYLDKLLDFEEGGYIEEALTLSVKLLETFPGKRAEILLEKAKLEFRNQMDKEALFDFISVHGITKDETLYDLILEAYYMPNERTLEENYHNNLKYLKEYPHYRGVETERVEWFPIWIDDELLVYTDRANKNFCLTIRHAKEIEEKRDKAAMAVNELWIEDLWKIEESFRLSSPFLDMDLPVYAVFDEGYWQLFLRLYDMEGLLEKNRIVFLVGEQNVYEYLRGDMVIFPDVAFYNGFQDNYCPIVEKEMEIRKKEKLEDGRYIKQYYEENQDNIIANVKSGKPRILFYTSYFTTALKYHTRDCMQAASRLGCEVQLLMEPDGIHRVYDKDIVQYIKRFKPDIIFNIDHFRFECSVVPEEIVWITWIQDPLQHILDSKTPSKLLKNDFVMNTYTGTEVKEIWQTFPREIFAPLVADDRIYKPYIMDKTEKEKYGADLCMVCHAANAEKGAEELLGLLKGGKERLIIKNMLRDYYNLVDAGGQIFYTREEMAGFIDEYAKQFYAAKLNDGFIEFLAERMCLDLAHRMYRQIVADWLIEAGYHKIKLWGNGWMESPKYHGYAMGVAQNGEILSKIYQSTKIVLGSNFYSTGVARVWESMLSGAFYLGNYIPPEVDAVDVRKVLKEGDNLVIYHNKQDLLDKVEYYLSHETERRQMAERGRRVALKERTYTALMQNVLAVLRKFLDPK